MLVFRKLLLSRFFGCEFVLFFFGLELGGFLFAFGTCSELVPNVVCLLNENFILLILLFFIEPWKNNLKLIIRPTPHLRILELKPLLESLLLEPLLLLRVNLILFSS